MAWHGMAWHGMAWHTCALDTLHHTRYLLPLPSLPPLPLLPWQLWVKEVPYLHDASKSFVCSFIDSMAGNLYSKDEFIDNGQ